MVSNYLKVGKDKDKEVKIALTIIHALFTAYGTRKPFEQSYYKSKRVGASNQRKYINALLK